MLKQLRNKRTMKQLLWATAILIIPPFVFWGAGSAMRSRQKGPDFAGTIFGRKISLEEYSASLQAAKNQALMMYGPKFNEVRDALGLDRMAWDRLMLLREAKNKGLKTPDKEVVETIQRFPFLQSRGQFDQRAYDLILNQAFRTSARQFEEDIRDSLTISKLRDSVIKNIRITNKEIKDAYKRENEKAKIAYILIPVNNFKNKVRINQRAIEKYYLDNAESFRVPEQVNAEYIGFEFADYQKDIQAGDEEIRDYYNKHKEEYGPKKELKDLKDTIKNKLIQNAARQKALLAAEKIDYILSDKTKNFEEAAKENSIPIKETGFFAKEGPIPQIGWFPDVQKTAFKLNIGERSELIKSDMEFVKGYYIIKLKEKNASYIPPAAEVNEKIENILKEDHAFGLASKEADRLHKRILELIKTNNMKFEDAATKIMYKPKYTELFAREGYIQGIGMASEIGEAAFNIREAVSSVAKTRAGYCIFHALEVMPIDEVRFKRERKDFDKKTLEAKKMKVLNEWYANLMKRANLKNNMSPSE